MQLSSKRYKYAILLCAPALVLALLGVKAKAQNDRHIGVVDNAARLALQGRRIFRFDTFGDQAFWGDTLKLHLAIEGPKFGGVGSGISPNAALAAGLKVDMAALPSTLVQQIGSGGVNLNDPAVTLMLLQMKAVIGLTGFFNPNGSLQSVGIQCALCHSTVDNSLPALCPASLQNRNPGTGCVGRRLDGWPNRDLNVGAIIAMAPDLSAFASLLNVSQDTVRSVLNSWGPGKFDAEMALDGKTVNTKQMSDGVVTGTSVSSATLIPPAFGLGGVDLHTWTGWGGIPHWNAFVAVLEMHGQGRFWDPRLNNPQFPIAASNGFADVKLPNGQYINPDDDQVTKKLAPLQFYQLAIASPKPPDGSFDKAASARGDELFSGKAKCNNCHVEPLWTDPGWNMHTPGEVCIDNFQASRAPDTRYRTSPIGALFTHSKGGFYHDGRFKTLNDVVAHYNTCMKLGLSSQEQSDLIQYLLSLTFGPQDSGGSSSEQ
jgi:hypothetical protein